MAPVHAIAELFGRSPFAALVRHTQKVHECVEAIEPLVRAFLDGDTGAVDSSYEAISDLEHEADLIKQEIRSHLPRSVILPVQRGDILKFLKEQDAIADTAEDIAVLLTIRRTQVPATLHSGILELTEKVVDVSGLLVAAASDLENLQDAVFEGKEAKLVAEMLDRVNHGEYKADKLQTKCAKALYAVEDEIDPVSVYFVMKLLRLLGEVANHAENTGDTLRMMLSSR